jgi:hypothetical protein
MPNTIGSRVTSPQIAHGAALRCRVENVLALMAHSLVDHPRGGDNTPLCRVLPKRLGIASRKRPPHAADNRRPAALPHSLKLL